MRLVKNRPNLHGETNKQRGSKQERQVPDDARDNQVKNSTRNKKISTVSQKSE